MMNHIILDDRPDVDCKRTFINRISTFMMVILLVSLEFQLTSEVTVIKCMTAFYKQHRSLVRYICAYLTVRNSIVASKVQICSGIQHPVYDFI